MASAAALFHSLIESAQLVGLEPGAYLAEAHAARSPRPAPWLFFDNGVHAE